jgi:hypothetical protein
MAYMINVNALFLYLICQCDRYIYNLLHHYQYIGPPGEDTKEQMMELLGYVRDNLEYVTPRRRFVLGSR